MTAPALRLVAVDGETFELALEYTPVEGVKWLFTRNGIYYVVRKINGKVVRKSLRTRDYHEALLRYAEAVGPEPTTLDRNVRIPEARAEFLRRAEADGLLKPATLATHHDCWRFAEDLLAGLRVGDVDGPLIDRILDRAELYISPRTGKPLSPSMLRKIKATLGSLFTSFTKAPTIYRTDNPVHAARRRSWERPRGEQVNEIVDEAHIVTDHELDLIVAELPKGARDEIDALKRQVIVQTMHRSGLRINEVLGLKLSDIVDGPRFGPHGSLKVQRQVAFKFKANDPASWEGSLKGRVGAVGVRMRYVTLSASIRGILDAYIERGRREKWLRADGLLFPTLKQSPLSSNFIQGKLKQAAKRAGIKRTIKSHYLRHSFATRLFTNGATIEEVAGALGNSPKVVSEVYIHFFNRENHSNRMAALAA